MSTTATISNLTGTENPIQLFYNALLAEDRRAQDRYFEAAKGELLKAVRSYTSNICPQDLTSYVFEKMLANVGKIENAPKWGVTVMLNKFRTSGRIDANRKFIREEKITPQSPSHTQPTVYSALELQDTLKVIHRVLPPESAEIFILYNMGFTSREISKMKAKSPKTIINKKASSTHKVHQALGAHQLI